MKAMLARLKTDTPQSGINMVDLMMWLVIAALLLATAIQGGSYYQKNAFLYQLSNDVANAGQNVMAEASSNNGRVNAEVVTRAIAITAKSESTIFTKFVQNDGSFTITATNPAIADIKAIYSSSNRDGLNPGVNRVSAHSTNYPSGEGLSGVSGTPKNMVLNSNTNQCLDNAWNGISAGNKVIYHLCNGGANQKWEWSGNGQIKLTQDLSLCLDISKDTKLSQLAKCSSSSSSQIFQTINSDNNEFSLFQPSSNQCLKKIPDPAYSGYFSLTPANCDDPETTRWKHILS